MLFSSNAASVLALAVSAGHWDVARSLTVPKGEGSGAASDKKKRLDKEQLMDLFKKRRAARAVEDEEKVAADAAAAADTDAGILRATAKDKALRGQRGLTKNVRTFFWLFEAGARAHAFSSLISLNFQLVSALRTGRSATELWRAIRLPAI